VLIVRPSDVELNGTVEEPSAELVGQECCQARGGLDGDQGCIDLP